jgi:hypothetical protein
MPWCNAENVRKEIGLTEADLPDADIDYYINKAQIELLSDMTSYAFETPMHGNIDGFNTTFSITLGPFADSDFDGVVSTSDITVYKWGNSGSIDTRVLCSISTIYPDFGIVVLTEAPSSTFEVVVADCYHYSKHINTAKIAHVTALLAAYHYVMAEQLLLPKQWMHGAYRFMKGTAAEDLLSEYHREKDLLSVASSRLSSHGSIRFNRDDF